MVFAHVLWDKSALYIFTTNSHDPIYLFTACVHTLESDAARLRASDRLVERQFTGGFMQDLWVDWLKVLGVFSHALVVYQWCKKLKNRVSYAHGLIAHQNIWQSSLPVEKLWL